MQQKARPVLLAHGVIWSKMSQHIRFVEGRVLNAELSQLPGGHVSQTVSVAERNSESIVFSLGGDFYTKDKFLWPSPPMFAGVGSFANRLKLVSQIFKTIMGEEAGEEGMAQLKKHLVPGSRSQQLPEELFSIKYAQQCRFKTPLG